MDINTYTPPDCHAHSNHEPCAKRARAGVPLTCSPSILEHLCLDIMDGISNFFDFNQWMQFSLASRKIRSLSNNGCLWRKLCENANIAVIKGESHYYKFREAYLNRSLLALFAAVRLFMLSKNHYLEKNINAILIDLYDIRCHRDFNKSFNTHISQNQIYKEIAQRIGYLKALYNIHNYAHPELTLDESIVKLQLANISSMPEVNKDFSRLLYSEPTSSDENMRILYNSKAPWIRNEAAGRTALMHYRQEINLLANDEVTDLAEKVYKDPDTAPFMRTTAGFLLATYKLGRPVDDMTNDQVAQLFQNAHTCPYLNLHEKAQANIRLAWMRIYFHTEIIDDIKAGQLLDEALSNIILTTEEWLQAGFYLAHMQISGRIQSVTRARMEGLLLNVISYPNLKDPAQYRSLAMFHLAQMRYNYETTIIDDQTAASFFSQIKADESLDSKTSLAATNLLRQMLTRGRLNQA
jgi:hypothetical protein